MATAKKGTKKTIEELLAQLKLDLRALDLKWTEKLEAQILADKTVDQVYKDDLNVRKIYNVFHNIVRDTGWKVLIYNQGKKLKAKLEKQIEKIID
jgi:hypothetical protein